MEDVEGVAVLPAQRRLPEAGLIANLVEFPAVPKNKARLRLQVMANHTDENVGDAVKRSISARLAADRSASANTTGTFRTSVVAAYVSRIS